MLDSLVYIYLRDAFYVKIHCYTLHFVFEGWVLC